MFVYPRYPRIYKQVIYIMRVRNLQRKIYLSDDENLKLNVVLENKKITLREYFLSCIIKDYKIIRGLR